jgi:hypothetical protein
MKGFKYSQQGLVYIIGGTLILLGTLGLLNWQFAWTIVAVGMIIYGLMLSGLDKSFKGVLPRKK